MLPYEIMLVSLLNSSYTVIQDQVQQLEGKKKGQLLDAMDENGSKHAL